MRTLILIAAFVVLASGCGMMMAPVLDIQNAPVATPAGMTPSIGRTRDAIFRGLADRGWTVDKEEGQTIVATVTAGGHQATVGIDYSAELLFDPLCNELARAQVRRARDSQALQPLGRSPARVDQQGARTVARPSARRARAGSHAGTRCACA